MLQVKIATISDANVISEISKQTFYEAFHLQNTKADMDLFLASNFSVANTEQELAKPNNTFYLVFDNHTLCAYAKVVAIDNSTELPSIKTLRISRIYVLNAFIGKGIGKLLMQTCLQKAQSLKKTHVWLGVWEQNTSAIAFYKRFGFEQFGTETFILGTDPQTDLLMQKAL
ncbi:MAG: GNAT family N-acetyltransferase [Flavobacterium sp.]|nr:GNAT family N-acetyltransferase [Flavobacterium sp.]